MVINNWINKLFQKKPIMAGETNLVVLLKTMKPTLNAGEYVFCTTTDFTNI